MAYGLKYQSEFYNVIGTLVQVQIFKEDYEDSAVIDLRTSEVKIEFNFQDHNTAVAGTGAKITVINTGSFNSLEDLLTSLEKQFRCDIYYNSILRFRGYSVCDLNEQRFLHRSAIVLQFTDYMRRMEDFHLACLNDISAYTSYLEIIQEFLTTIDLNPTLYVNSTLFETTMSNGATDTFLEQTHVEDCNFFSNPVDYDNAYDVINKILLPTGSYLYSSEGAWYLERQEDITSDHPWVQMDLISSDGSGTSIANRKQSINKQDGDYQYVDTSQNIEYDSGLQKLIINQIDKQLDTAVFNNYNENTPTISCTIMPTAGSIPLRQWRIHEHCVNLEKKYAFRGMETCLGWRYAEADQYEYDGLYYCFENQFNITEDNPMSLNVDYTMSTDYPMAPVVSVTLRFMIRVDGGPYSNYFIGRIPFPETPSETFPGIISGLSPELLASGAILWEETMTLNTATTSKEKVWNMSKEIDFSSQFIDPSQPAHAIQSIWQALGSPAKQRFIIGFFPPKIILAGNPPPIPYDISRSVWFGDASITISQKDIPNKFTYYINRNFIKTEEVDFDFFDLNNMNFSNGLIAADGETKTDLWNSENNPTAVSLMKIFVKTRFRNYCRTIHRLKSTIRCNNYLKPFTVITDDNLADDSAHNLDLILLNYTWDPVNATYEIEAEEYTDEEIILDDSGEGIESSGGGGSSGTTSLNTLTITSVIQTIPGGPIDVHWNTVTGATGYRLQRRPNWQPGFGYWSQVWQTVYSGELNGYTDYIMVEHTPTGGMEFEYQVCAYNSNVSSVYSSTSSINWETY